MTLKLHKALDNVDPTISELVDAEYDRQETVLEMIPSENRASEAVLEAIGTTLNNKYAEGYPGKRYYGGAEVVDKVEQLAIDRAKALFGANYANVQPYSGSPANIEIYFALLNFGDKVMGFSLSEGGHLTHGHPVNFSGRSYSFEQYGVDKKTETLDYDAIERQAKRVKPKMMVGGSTAYPRTFDFKRFCEIAESVSAISMIDMSHVGGLVAGGAHPSPFPEADVVMTTTHKTLRGPRGAIIFSKSKEHANAIRKAVFPGMQGGPHEHCIAGIAVALHEAAQPDFKVYARQIVKNAQTLADVLMSNGVRLVSGGTDNHLILADMTPLGLSGSEAETALDKAGITVNKNTVPFDSRQPFDPSGIRMGTPYLTTRGFKESDMKLVGELMFKALKGAKDEATLGRVRAEVRELCGRFPLY